jgi:hypothetical protein
MFCLANNIYLVCEHVIQVLMVGSMGKADYLCEMNLGECEAVSQEKRPVEWCNS